MTKTTRVMLAVLALCGTSAALAQSSVTLYGRVNTSIESQKLGNQSVSGMVSNSSYVGFRGVEDLGSGLKAGFILETQFNSDDGSGAGGAGIDFTRNSEVNLAGSFGTVRLGTFDPASYLATADVVSMHNHDTGTTADALYWYNDSTANKIAYVTPDFGGVTAELQYSLGEKAIAGGLQDRGAWDLGINYSAGALGVGFGYSTQNKKLAAGTGPKASKDQMAVRVSYALGDLTLAGYYMRGQDETDPTFLGLKKKIDTYRLSAMYTLGASEFHANIGRANKTKIGSTSIAQSSATQWTLAYNYNLSKRTKAYAMYSKVSNGNASSYGPTSLGGAVGAGQDFRTFGLGVRHLF